MESKTFNSKQPFLGLHPPKAKKRSLILPCATLFLAVIIGAAHHFFYSWLDGQGIDVFPSTWALRIGTAAAYLFKTFVAITMGMAYVQRIWLSVRKRAFTLEGLNAMFAAAEQPRHAILHKEMWTSAKVALLVALLGASLPLVPILSPATISIVVDTHTVTGGCSVPSGDIKSPAFSNQLALIDNSGFYARPAPLLQQAVIQALTGRPVTWTSRCGANCTYELQLPSLYLNCTDNTETSSQPILEQTELYSARSMDLVTTDTNENVSPLEVEWSTKNTPGIGDQRLYCIPRKTIYSIQVTYANGVQNNTVKGHTIDTSVFGKPQSGSLPIASGESERVMMAAMLDAVYNILGGSLDTNPAGTGTSTDLLSLSTFIQATGTSVRSYKFGDVKAGIEKLMVDTSLSLYSLADTFSPPLLTSGTCQQSNSELKFSYKPLALLAAYGIALAIGIAALSIGLHALLGPNQRQLGETSFSAVMAATRNETIDALYGDANITPERMASTKFRYGRLSNGREAFGVREDFR